MATKKKPIPQEGTEEWKAYRHELIRREIAKRCYADYLPYVHGEGWRKTRMSQYLAERVQAFLEEDTGHAYDIMIIQTPPQHGKSLTITETLPSWYLGNHPKARVIEVSYNIDTAERFSTANKRKVEEFGKNIFGIELGKIARSTYFELKSGGTMRSFGVTSGITGNAADLLIIDDPIKNRQEADSETMRSSLWAEWRNSMMSRLSAGAKVILIATPWHEDDIAARILKTEAKRVTLIRLPVEAQEDDLLGRKPGEALCPEIGKGQEWLHDFRESYMSDPEGGSRAWNALYMCNPVIEGGNLVRREWWRFYNPEDVTEFGVQCISVDATFKDGENNDYVAIQVWGKRDIDCYLLHSVNEHLDFPGTVAKIKQLRALFPGATRVYIEDKANGSAIIQMLQREMTGVIAVNPLGGKVARVNAVSSMIETGHVFLPSNATWIEDYLRQWSEFPAGKHDDMVDASSQALSQLQQLYGGGYRPVVQTREEAYMQQAQDEYLNPEIYDAYGVGDGWSSMTLNIGSYGRYM